MVTIDKCCRRPSKLMINTVLKFNVINAVETTQRLKVCQETQRGKPGHRLLPINK